MSVRFGMYQVYLAISNHTVYTCSAYLVCNVLYKPLTPGLFSNTTDTYPQDHMCPVVPHSHGLLFY